MFRQPRINKREKNNMSLFLVEQELLTILEHLSSPPVLSGVFVTQSLVFCVVFCRSIFVFLCFILAIVLSVILRCTASDYPSGIFKLFLYEVHLVFNRVLIQFVSQLRGTTLPEENLKSSLYVRM